MHNNFYTQPDAIREVLSHVDRSTLSDSALQLLDSLNDMADKVDPEHNSGNIDMQICDLNSYYSSILWSGKEDVAYLINSGDIDESLLQQIFPEDLPQLIEDVTDSIYWNDDAFIDCSAGNDVIREKIEEVFSNYIDKKPFVFEDIDFETDLTTGYWYGQLRTNDFLYDKLEKATLDPDDLDLLDENHPKLNCAFFAEFDVCTQSVSVFGETYLRDGMEPDPIEDLIPLTPEEAKLLTSVFENICQHQYNGKDCLTVLNDERVAMGLTPFKRPLDVAISNAKANLQPSNEPQREPTPSR